MWSKIPGWKVITLNGCKNVALSKYWFKKIARQLDNDKDLNCEIRNNILLPLSSSRKGSLYSWQLMLYGKCRWYQKINAKFGLKKNT